LIYTNKWVIWTIISNVQKHTWRKTDKYPKMTYGKKALKSGETKGLFFSFRIFSQSASIHIIPCLIVSCYFESMSSVCARYMREYIIVMEFLS